MSEYYAYYNVGDDATGSGTIASPWESLQKLADTCVAGDIGYYRVDSNESGVIGAAVDFDTNTGSTASGYITFKGCVDSWTPSSLRSKRALVDGNSTLPSLIKSYAGYDYIFFENMDFTRAATEILEAATATAYAWVFKNCIFRNSPIAIRPLTALRFMRLYRCEFESLSTYGLQAYNAAALYCSFRSCVNGIVLYGQTCVAYGCVSYDCVYSFNMNSTGAIVLSCIADNAGNASFNIVGSNCIASDILATNSPIGIDLESSNDDVVISNVGLYNNVSDIDEAGAVLRLTDETDLEKDPYIDSASNNFVPSSNMELLDVETVLDANNIVYPTAGIKPKSVTRGMGGMNGGING